MRRLALVVLVLGSFGSVACGSAAEPLPALGADGGPAASSELPGQAPGADGGRGDGRPAEPPAPPAKAEEVTEQYGVFVAKDGAAENPGTRKSPLASITEGIAKAKADKKGRVYVCEGTYLESLELESGVSHALSADTEVVCGAHDFYDSWLWLRHRGESVLNLNDCPFADDTKLRAMRGLPAPVLTVLEQSQFAQFCRHKTGHGLGLDVHEAPQIMRGNKEMLEPGMVFTIEPGLYRDGDAGVRIEDDVVVTEDGIECLTSFPRELRIVG